VSDKSSKPRRTDRERAAKMRANYTNPYKTVSAAQRRIKDELHEERAAGGERVRRQRDSSSRRDETTPHDLIEQALRNPTKFVSEAELREQYHHVLTDLRNMGMLAVGLIVVLIVLALVLPR
jgi:hypothetical protein